MRGVTRLVVVSVVGVLVVLVKNPPGENPGFSTEAAFGSSARPGGHAPS